MHWLYIYIFKSILDTVYVIRIHEKLVIHSDLGKAASWKRLTEKFLNLPLPSTEETKVCMLQFVLFFPPSCIYTDNGGFSCNVVLDISGDLVVGSGVAVQVMDLLK